VSGKPDYHAPNSDAICTHQHCRGAAASSSSIDVGQPARKADLHESIGMLA
jgi:hypothetical protein